MVIPNERPNKPTKPRKSRERSLPVPVPVPAAALNVINPAAAGIDVHSDMHVVCIPADSDAHPVRQFGTNTADLQEIVAWLKKCRVNKTANVLNKMPKSSQPKPRGCSTRSTWLKPESRRSRRSTCS